MKRAIIAFAILAAAVHLSAQPNNPSPVPWYSSTPPTSCPRALPIYIIAPGYTGAGNIYGNASTTTGVTCSLLVSAGGGPATSVPFSGVTTGENDTGLTVGTGGVLTPVNGGFINANELGGLTLANYFASPPAIGGTAPAAGAFTTLSATGLSTFSNSPGTTAGAYGNLFTFTPQTASLYNPGLYVKCAGQTDPAFNTTGESVTITNCSGGSASGRLIDGYYGTTSEFYVTNNGLAYFNNQVLTVATGQFQFNGRSNISSSTTGLINVGTGTTSGTGGSLSMTNSTESGANSAALYSTATNCSSSASPAVCAAAAAGSATVAAAATTEVVNTTAITANSQIQLTFDSSLGTKLGVTCNTSPAVLSVSARTAGTSFTVTSAAPTTNPDCFSYNITN